MPVKYNASTDIKEYLCREQKTPYYFAIGILISTAVLKMSVTFDLIF
jgi:hypothetical protein